MQIEELENMVGGWFVGNFNPSLYSTNAVEVAVKKYRAGTCGEWHFHKIATEITVIVSGQVEMNGRKYQAGDIIVIYPNEGTDFLALTDAVTTVVKLPGANDDKYMRAENA